MSKRKSKSGSAPAPPASVKLSPVTCLRCGRTWTPRKPDPRNCPSCGTQAWNIPPEPEASAMDPAPAEEIPPQDYYPADIPEVPQPAPPAAPALEASAPIVQQAPVPVPPPAPELPAVLAVRHEADLPPPGERKEKKKRKEKPPREPKEPRPRSKISDAHPGLYEMAATILPRSPILLILIGLTFSALSSIIVGNYLFVMDWYRISIVGPLFVHIWTYTGGPGAWFEDYWPLVALLGTLALTLAFVVWALPWRFAFKDYVVIRGHVKTKDGRIMWSTDNLWTRMWDGMYGTPPRDKVELWLKHRFLWNPLLPSKGLIKLTLDREIEKPGFDGPFTYTAEERRYRMFVGLDEMVTTDDAQQSRPIPLDDANANFHVRGKHLVNDTQKFSLANPQVRLEKLKQGTHIVPQDLKEAAEIARAKRGEG